MSREKIVKMDGSYALCLNKIEEEWYNGWCLLSTNKMIQSKEHWGLQNEESNKITRNNYHYSSVFCGSHKLMKLSTQIVGHESNL